MCKRVVQEHSKTEVEDKIGLTASPVEIADVFQLWQQRCGWLEKKMVVVWGMKSV